MPELVAKGSQGELCARIAEPGHVARQGVLVQQYDRGAPYLVGKGSFTGSHPQYGWEVQEEIPGKFRKDPGNALRAFPGIPLKSTAGIPLALSFKAFEASRAFPEFSPPPQYALGTPLFPQVAPERASQSCCHGIPAVLRVCLIYKGSSQRKSLCRSFKKQHELGQQGRQL